MRFLDRLTELPAPAKFLFVALVTAAVAGVAFSLHASVEQASLALIGAVVFAAGAGRLAGLFTAVFAAAILNFAFTPPLWTLRVGNGDDTVALVIFGALALTVSSMVARVAELRTAADLRANESASAAREQVRLAREADTARAAAELSRTRAGLLSAVSHNLRTPLAAIHASASTLLTDGALISESEKIELMTTVRDEAVRLSGLVAKVLDLGRIRVGGLEVTPEQIDVEGALQAAAHRLKPLLATRTISIAAAPDANMCEADPSAVEQILTNLLENALRYTPSDSPIELTASRQRGAIEMRVIDHGPGVAPADSDRIFEEFVRVGARVESDGTGLGLAIVKAYVNAHRGRVWVEETPGGGATFAVRFPIVYEQ